MTSNREQLNILDYVKRETRTFSEHPFGDVDSVILCKLACVRYNGIVPSPYEMGVPITFGELLKAKWNISMTGGIFNEDKVLQLLVAVCNSPRFSDIGIICYEENTDKDAQEQFSAVTFILPCNKAYLAFRGTDPSLVGWQEDCNMTFMDEVPSQESALRYTEAVAKLTDLPLILGGHSKGGNIAIYAAVGADEAIKNRIETIYDHDGPGFRKEVLEKFSQRDLTEILPKIRKTIPESSVVGLLLTTKANFSIVASSEKNLAQHDTFSWLIDGDDFIRVEELSKSAEIMRASMDDFLSQVSDEDKEKFIDAFFQIITAGGADMVQDFKEERFSNTLAMIGAIKDISPETRKLLVKTAKLFATLSVKNFHQMNRGKIDKD